MTVRNLIVTCLLRQDELAFIPIKDNLRLQVLPSLEYLPYCQRHQGAAFIQDQQLFVVWADDVESAEQRANAYLDQIIQMFSQGFSDVGSKSSKQDILVSEIPVDSGGVSLESSDTECNIRESPRRPVLIQAVLSALTLTCIFAAIGGGWRQIAIELAVDNNYIRLAFLLVAPFQIWLALVSALNVTFLSRS